MARFDVQGISTDFTDVGRNKSSISTKYHIFPWKWVTLNKQIGIQSFKLTLLVKGGFTPNHKLFQISRSLDSRFLMVESCQFWILKPKLWASQIFTLIHLINNLVWAKSSKLMTFEENKISVQQLPYAFHCSLYSPLRWYKKVAVLKELCYKMQFVKNVLYTSSVSSPLVFFFVTVFMRVLSLKLFQ